MFDRLARYWAPKRFKKPSFDDLLVFLDVFTDKFSKIGDQIVLRLEFFDDVGVLFA